MYRTIVICIIACSLFNINEPASLSDLWELHFDRAVLSNSTYLPGYYNVSLLHVSRMNRTTFGINAQFELFIDLDERCDLTLETYYKRLPGHEFTKSPLHSPTMPFPDHYRKHFMATKGLIDTLQCCSNIPPYESIEQIYIWKKVNAVNAI